MSIRLRKSNKAAIEKQGTSQIRVYLRLDIFLAFYEKRVVELERRGRCASALDLFVIFFFYLFFGLVVGGSGELPTEKRPQKKQI